MMRRLTLLLVGTALALPGAAEAGRFAVGVVPGTSAQALAQRLEARTGGSASVIGPFAVALSAPSPRDIVGMRGVAYVERLSTRRLAFVPTDPLFTRQWYIPAVRGFESWVQRPTLPAMRIAVIDSGIDGDHPEFRGRIAAHKSFVGGSALRDAKGHGTFVAGLMAAKLDNGEGIAGMAFPARLVVAKVVRPDGVVPLEAEARAIRWAVDEGKARVINLSLGGVRDPLDPDHDSFSQLEANAVEYAIRRGAIVVAAVGNGDQAPEQPWRYASYPAALPHVLGVSALARDGSVPAFSNRDAIYNDIAAPGDELISTLPRALTLARPTCLEQGYSDCGPPDFRRAQGTSFAAAIVSAAAVLVRGAWPALSAEQIVGLMERSAADQTPATGCRRCTAERDSLTGWGRLDIAAAVDWNPSRRLPPADRHEPNDDAGARSITVKRKKPIVRLRASVDYWDDQNDVYAVPLRRGQRLRAVLIGPDTADLNIVFWRPGTKRVDDHRTVTSKLINHSKQRRGTTQRLSHRAGRAGLYYVQVKISSPGAGVYRLWLIRK